MKEVIIMYIRNTYTTYRAFVGLFSCMASHVDNKHVLGLKWLFTTRAIDPATDECFLVALNVIIVNVLNKFVLGNELNATVAPMAIRLNEVARLILNVRCIRRRAVVFVKLMIWIFIVAMHPMIPA